MAEIVEYRKERTLPEYEQMKRIELFDEAEIREIIKKRDFLNGKIARQNKSMRDYLEFIKYERDLISLIQKRRKTRNIQEKKGNIEFSIATRIKNLYNQVTVRFPQNVRIWEEFLKFAKMFKFHKDIATILDNMVRQHGDKPDMWLRAVVWEYEQTQNMERVKHFMLGGLQRHPENCKLYCKFLKIKLLEAEKIDDQTEVGATDRKLVLEQAKIIYENSRKKIHSVEYLADILEIIQEFSIAGDLQKMVLKDMQKDFLLEELMWHTLARRELMGLHMKDDKEEEIMSTPKKRLERCVQVYSEATKILKTEKMWSFYINTMLELNQDNSVQANLNQQGLHTALKGAYEAGFLSESHFIHYIDQLVKTEDTQMEYVLEIFDKATKTFPLSGRLWEMWMRFHIQNESEQSLYEVFRQGVKKIGENSYPLWQLIIQYYQARSDLPNRVEQIFNEAMMQPSSVASKLKAQYIEFLAVTKDINSARQKYEELVRNTTPCLEIHEKMAYLESIQCDPNVDSWRKCHEYSVQFFGQQHTKVWIDYIKFEKCQDSPKNISHIYDRAVKTLNVDLVNTFMVEHNLLNLV
ncbi:hypothetical protein DMENIID0001_095980 [Sergentomyia squamirostris]